MPGYGVVATVEYIALPLAVEDPFAGTAFIAAVFIDRAPALGRPTRDLDCSAIGAVEQMPVTVQRFIAGLNDRHGDPIQTRRYRRVQIVRRIHGHENIADRKIPDKAIQRVIDTMRMN